MIDKIQESGTIIEKNFINNAELTHKEKFYSDQLDNIAKKNESKSIDDFESDFINGFRLEQDIQLSLEKYQKEQESDRLIAELEKKEARIKELEQVIGVIATNQYAEKQGPILPAMVASDSNKKRVYPTA